MPIKWVDNILSHNKIGGVRQQRQGVARRLSVEALLTLALTALLVQELSVPTMIAINIADGIIKGGGRHARGLGLAVEIDLSAFQTSLLDRLESAVEIAPVPRRGRPPTNKTGRLD